MTATRRFRWAPAEGWLTLGLVILICLTMAWAIDDARWVLGRANYLDFLPFAAIGGVLSAFIGVKVGWGRWLTYLVGSVVAALILPLIVALIVYPDGAPLHDLYEATATAAVAAWVDIAIRGQPTTIQYLHHVLAIGLLVWATSMFASYAVFGHRRPLNGVVAVGIVLVANMALTENDQLIYLVLYSLASLFLLVRGHVFDEQGEWIRRRIGDPGSISSVYLRGGTIFIGAAVVGSMLLTETASSKPLEGAWGGLTDNVVSWSQTLSRFLPTGGQTRSLALTFGENALVMQQWQNNDEVAVTIQRPAADKGVYYWRVRAYDRIDLTSWGVTAQKAIDVGAGTDIFAGRADNVPAEGRHALTFSVTPDTFHDPTVLAPNTAVQVNEPTKLVTVGTDGYFSSITLDDRGSYDVSALTEGDGDGNGKGQISQNALKAAPTTYPDQIRQYYIGNFATDAIGPYARALENEVVAQAGSRNPYDLASTMVHVLQSSEFHYSQDVRKVDCVGLSTVECFAHYKTGFCQYYATTMAVLLRDLGIPTRIVAGFLPGQRDVLTGVERILNSDAHAWVEVYFPTYGWVTFDPTGGNVSQLAPLPTGPAIASVKPSVGPPATAPVGSLRLRDPGDGRDATGGTSGALSRSALGPLVAVGLLLLLIVMVVSAVVWRRGPRGPVSPDGAYGMVVRIATRLGFGPRPTQTIYEYAGALGELLPDSRPELQLVAQAKVETTYGRAVLGEDRLAGLRAAQRRLRLGLLKLIGRRRERPRRRRGLRGLRGL